MTDNPVVTKENQIKLKAFISKDGQTEYELILTLGKNALNSLAQKLDLKKCVPNPTNLNWLNIDTKNNTIEIKLD